MAKGLTVEVIVYEWSEEREDLPLDTKIVVHYTKSELKEYEDLDDLVADKLVDMYDATPYDYIVL